MTERFTIRPITPADDAAVAGALLAGVLDDLAAALAHRAGALDGEEALLGPHQ